MRILTVKKAREYLLAKGVDWTEVWIRRQMGDGRIKFERNLNSVGIKVTELNRIVRERKA